MLHQTKVRKICRLLDRQKRRLKQERSVVYREIAAVVGCSVDTVSRIARCGPNKAQSPVMRSHKAIPTTVFCRKCGPVRGEFCVRCNAEESDGINPDDLLEGEGPSCNDPTPDEIASRAMEARRMHLGRKKHGKNRIDYNDPVIAAFVATPENCLASALS